MLESLPGTSPWLSGLPYYYVRGAPPETVGYFVDGIRVPLLFHVGPGPSTIAPALVDSVDLFSAAYPAHYGRYAGAVIAGETTPPATDRPHGEFSARVYDASAYGELPVDGGKGSVAAASRYAYTGPLISLIVPDYSLDYWDYQLRASHAVGDAGTLTLFAFGAHDELHYRGQPSFRIEYHRVDLRYDRPIQGGNVRVAFTANYDDSLTTVSSDSGGTDQAGRKGPGWRLRTEVDEHVAARARLRAGADIGATMFTVDRVPVIDGIEPPIGPHTDVEGGAYADVVWRPGAGLELVPGFRFDGYLTRGRTEWAPQPRLAAKIQILPRLSLLSSVGAAHQEPTEAIFLPGKIPYGVSQASQESYQFSEGAEVVLPSSLRARVSGYYARLVAEHVLGTDQTQLGESYGLEAFVHRDFTQRLGGFVSYTLGRTNGTAGGVTERVSWDRTHVVSMVAGYDLGRGWRVGARLFFESGRPLPPVCLFGCSSPSGPAATYHPTGDLPPFWRVDARLEKRWTFPAGQWLAATLECFNLLGMREAVNDSHPPDSTSLTEVKVEYQSAIILPTIGLEGGL
ncbi:MAG: TonB-dependent receptor plug domain-containing protein [Polyangiaceae bacterium]